MSKDLRVVGVSVFLGILMVPFAYGQETILVASFINGNTDFFKSRVYLWNPTETAGNVTVRVFTVPRPEPSDPPEPSELRIQKLKGQGLSIRRIASEMNISKSTISRLLNTVP